MSVHSGLKATVLPATARCPTCTRKININTNKYNYFKTLNTYIKNKFTNHWVPSHIPSTCDCCSLLVFTRTFGNNIYVLWQSGVRMGAHWVVLCVGLGASVWCSGVTCRSNITRHVLSAFRRKRQWLLNVSFRQDNIISVLLTISAVNVLRVVVRGGEPPPRQCCLHAFR